MEHGEDIKGLCLLTASLKINISKLLGIIHEILFLPQKKMIEKKVALLRCESRDSDSDGGMKESGKKNIHGNYEL